MRIVITSDHAGHELRKIIMDHLNTYENMEVLDLGPINGESCDYPDHVHPLCEVISSYDGGILICGSANGVAMTANKYPEVRCAVAWDPEISELSRLHNDSNCIAIPSRYVDNEKAKTIVDKFINTGFEGGRHIKRVEKIKIAK